MGNSWFKKNVEGLEKWFRDYKHWLLCQRTWVGFPAPMWQLKLSGTPVLEDPDFSSHLLRHQDHMWYIGIHVAKIPACININKYINNMHRNHTKCPGRLHVTVTSVLEKLRQKDRASKARLDNKTYLKKIKKKRKEKKSPVQRVKGVGKESRWGMLPGTQACSNRQPRKGASKDEDVTEREILGLWDTHFQIRRIWREWADTEPYWSYNSLTLGANNTGGTKQMS